MIRPHRLVSLTAATLFLLPALASAQRLTLPPPGANQHAAVTQYMGPVSVTIAYNAPDVTSPQGEDRTGKIWGQLVPMGIAPNPFYPGFGTAQSMPWRVGANEATKITFSHDVEVEGEAIAAGTYALFMAPGEEKWSVIFNENHEAWGSFFYDPALDVLSVEVEPQETDFFREWLTFEFDDRQLDTAVAVLHWENMRVPFRISVPGQAEIYHRTIAHELTGAAGFSFQNWVQASQWAAGQEAYHDDAVQWADTAIGNTANWQTLSNKAQVLNRVGRNEEAMTALDAAIDHPTATAQQIHFAGRGLQQQGQMEAANLIFRKNYEKHADEWPVHIGMARVYSNTGDFDKALEHARKALDQAPNDQQKQAVQGQIEQLEERVDINP